MQVEVIPMLINGDFLNAPLDVKMHLADYKMYGEDSYVFQQKELLHGLYECTYLSMNDRRINGEALEYFAKKNKPGIALASICDIENAHTFATLTTMQAVANSSTAMTAVLNSSTAITAVANSSTAMQAVANSSTAMQAVANSAKALHSICKSQNASLAIKTALQNVTIRNLILNTLNNSPQLFSKNETAWYCYEVGTGKIVRVVNDKNTIVIPTGIAAYYRDLEKGCLYYGADSSEIACYTGLKLDGSIKNIDNIVSLRGLYFYGKTFVRTYATVFTAIEEV